MDEITYLHPERIHLVWVALAVVAALVLLEMRGQRMLSRFVSQAMQIRLASRPSQMQRILRVGFIAATLMLGVVALMRPQTRREETQGVRKASADIMVVLDVSKSMLAADIAPNRLDRARAELRAMMTQLSGHRVGLIAFAGRPTVLSPLTSDHSFFQLVLDSADPSLVSVGGTRIGDALRKAVESFPEERRGARVVLLLTDGDDHESYPLDAADAARREGVQVVAIGFGEPKTAEGQGGEIELLDPETGARTVLRDRDGNVVRSYLGVDMLDDVSRRTNGVFHRAGASFDLNTYIEPYIEETEEEITREIVEERYEGFLFGAMICLFCSALASMRVRRRSELDEEDA